MPAGVGKMLGSPGKGNAILLPNDVTIRQEKQITLNTNPFCEEQAGRLGLTPKHARWWERERRVCHIAKVEFPNRQRHADREPPRDERRATGGSRTPSCVAPRASSTGRRRSRRRS